MSVELVASTIPPVTAGAIIGIILYMKREREACIARIEKQLDKIMEFMQTREKIERELEGRLSKLEGRNIERDTSHKDSMAHNSQQKEDYNEYSD
jgi:hypothetical protein